MNLSVVISRSNKVNFSALVTTSVNKLINSFFFLIPRMIRVIAVEIS